MKSLFCTADHITMETGGGAATANELEALRSVSEVGLVLSHDDISPSKFRMPESPFLYDLLALEAVRRHEQDNGPFDLAHFYSGTFTQTVRHLKERGAKVSYMVAAHDRTLTVEEFGRLGLEYPFEHIKDDYLFEIYSEGYRLADIVLTQSSRSKEVLKGMGCERVVVVPGGIIWPKKVSPIPERFDVAYVGAVGPDKGLIYLIQSWGMLNYPDSRLILAGWGTDQLEPFIRRVTDKGQFLLLGRVKDVADVYNACSVYVQPSVTEGFGLEIPEAMSYGRMVVASEGAGAAGIIEDGIDGFRIPIRSPDKIAEKIDWLKQHRPEMIEMGQRARRKARNYTWDKVRKMYAKVFLEVSNDLST